MSAIKKLGEKLVEVMKECSHIDKDGNNKQQNYKYVSASNVAKMVSASLVRHRLYTSVRTEVQKEETILSDDKIKKFIVVKLFLTIHDCDSSDSVTIESLGSSLNSGDKGTAIAQTMALKYAWLLALNISTLEDEPDDDRNTEFFGSRGGGGGGHSGKPSTEPEFSPTVPYVKNGHNPVDFAPTTDIQKFVRLYESAKSRSDYEEAFSTIRKNWGKISKQDQGIVSSAATSARKRLGISFDDVKKGSSDERHSSV